MPRSAVDFAAGMIPKLSLVLSCLTLVAPSAKADQTALGQSTFSASQSHSSSVYERITAINNKSLPEPINCWGTVLWTVGFIDKIRPAMKSELLYYLGSKACRKLEQNEVARPGDIVSEYKEEGIVHSFLVTGEHEQFGKASPSGKDRPKFGALEDFKKRPGCKRSEDGHCDFGIVIYRCDMSLIAEKREEARSEQSASRQQIESLALAYRKSLEGGSRTAQYDAFERFIKFTEELIDQGSWREPEKWVRMYPASAEILLMITEAKDPAEFFKPLLPQISDLETRLQQIEAGTPNEFVDFPVGGLKEK